MIRREHYDSDEQFRIADKVSILANESPDLVGYRICPECKNQSAEYGFKNDYLCIYHRVLLEYSLDSSYLDV